MVKNITSILLFLFFISCTNEPVTISGIESKSLEEYILNGEKIYTANCIECHKSNLEGADNWKSGKDVDGHRLPPPINGTGHAWHHSPEQLFNTIKYGLVYFDLKYEGKMNGFEKLSDDEIWMVIEFIYSKWPEDIKNIYNENFLE